MKNLLLVSLVVLFPNLSDASSREANRIACDIAEQIRKGSVPREKLNQLFEEIPGSDSDSRSRGDSVSSDDSAHSAEFIQTLRDDLELAFQHRSGYDLTSKGIESFVEALHALETILNPNLLEDGANLVVEYMNP